MKTKNLTFIIIGLLVLLLPLLTTAETGKEVIKPSEKPKIELVFALDTTGSMSGLIKAAKDKVWSIATTMATAKPAPEIKIGIVGYRDRGDAYITTITDMTQDIDLVYQKLMAFSANGGGDTPESVNQALYDAVHKNNWSSDSEKTYKVIFLVGDAPPHMDYNNDVKFQQTCRKASEKGIIINTVQCGSIAGTSKIWKEIATLCDGNYFRVSQDGDSKDYKTPFDKEIADKSRKLNETKIYYGNKSFHKKNQSKIDAINDIYSKAEASAIAKRSSYNMSKSGGKNFLGNQELIDSVSTGKVTLEDIKEKELPPAMQKMTVNERKLYIKQKSADRQKAASDLRVLSEKRQAYIKEIVEKEKDKGENSFDMKLYKCIKKQAEKKEIHYDGNLKY